METALFERFRALEAIRPSAGSMQDGENLDSILADSVCDEKWSSGNDELTGSRYSPFSTHVRMFFQVFDAGQDSLDRLSGCFDVLLRQVFVRGFEMAHGQRCPPQLHFVRRLPNIFLTCSWSTSFPALA